MSYIKHQILRVAGNIDFNMPPMITAVRFRDMTRLQGSQIFLQVREFKVFNIRGDEVDLSSAIASASSFDSASLLPQNAIDGDSNTSWANEGNDFPVTFTINFGAPVSISKIQFADVVGTVGVGPRGAGSFFIDVFPVGGSEWVLVETYSDLVNEDYEDPGGQGFFDVNYEV